jgi:hypothetical protein
MSTMSKILTFAFLIAIVVVILATIGVVVSPMLFSKAFPQGVDQWTVAGLTETFAGMMAALLAIIGAAVVAFNWLYLEQRVERILKEKTDTIKQELFTSLNERIRAMGEFAIIWNYPLEEKDRYAEQVLQRVPDIPNVAASMAEEYILYIINAETVELQLIDTDQKKLREVASIRVSYPSKSRLKIGPGRLSRDKALDRANYWAQKALDARKSHDPGFPELVMAEVRALQKEPDSTIDHLEQALQKDPSFKEMIVKDNDYWSLFTSMTRDESQQKKLDALLKLLNLERPSMEDVRNHCIHRDENQQARFSAIKKSDGEYALIVIDGVQKHLDDPKITWRIRASGDFNKSAADLDKVMKIIEEIFIPTKLIPNEV